MTKQVLIASTTIPKQERIIKLEYILFSVVEILPLEKYTIVSKVIYITLVIVIGIVSIISPL